MGGTVKTLVVHAAHIKNVPGRKTEAQDGSWIAQLLECGLLQGSFVPPRDIREIRDLTRYRKTLVQQRTEEVLRLHGGPATSRHQIIIGRFQQHGGVRAGDDRGDDCGQ
jgi:hypothetical protein